MKLFSRRRWRLYQPKRKAAVFVSNPKNYAAHEWHWSMFNCWADPVVHLLVLKSTIGLNIEEPNWRVLRRLTRWHDQRGRWQPGYDRRAEQPCIHPEQLRVRPESPSCRSWHRSSCPTLHRRRQTAWAGSWPHRSVEVERRMVVVGFRRGGRPRCR